MIREAIKRIGWRLSNGPFEVNRNDIEAFNDISVFVEKAQKKQFEHNELFAKMYIYTAMKIMENDNSTVFDANHRKKIGNLLALPLDQIIENLTDSLNDSEQYGVLKDAGLDLRHPALLKTSERADNMDKINEALKTPLNEERLFGKVWDFEAVKNGMIAEVNNMINLHR